MKTVFRSYELGISGHDYCTRVHGQDQEGHVSFQQAVEKFWKQRAPVEVFSPVKITRC